MKPYRAIIWVSFLLIVGEGIVLSGLNFVPTVSDGGVVLGEGTSAALEEIAAIQHPASYYTLDVLASVVSAETEIVPEETVAPSEESGGFIEEELPQVDRLVEVLNTPALGEVMQATGAEEEDETAEPRVSELIQKNERLYRERLIKELDQVRKDMESFRDELDG